MARGDARLVLYGPAARHGARKKKALKEFYWYIVHKRRELSTGYGLHARREAELALADYIRNDTADASALTVADAFKSYIDSNPEPHSKTRAINASGYVVPELGGELCVELDKTVLDGYYQKRVKGGVAPWTAWTELSRLRTAVRHVLGDAAKRMWLPPKPASAGVAITRDQIASLLRARRHIRWRKSRLNICLLVVVALYCCQRKEACMQLSWTRRRGYGYVDLDAMRICFKKVGEPENKKRRADMPIPRPLRVPLRQARRRTKRWVFEEIDGNRLADLGNAWETLRVAAGMPDFRIHDLIHTGSTLRARSTPQHVLSKLINKSAATLSSVYLHAELEELEEAANLAPGKRRKI